MHFEKNTDIQLMSFSSHKLSVPLTIIDVSLGPLAADVFGKFLPFHVVVFRGHALCAARA